jgi:hydroxymethylpyrimidine pyrophosphatase-like HAD family hydrolase
MSIKLIAVDMDGTFLSDAKTYNRRASSPSISECASRIFASSSPAATSITS